jgi:hypothetical protein
MLRRLRGRVNVTIHRTAFVVVRGDQDEGRDSHKGGEEKGNDEVRYAEKRAYLGIGGVVIVVWVVLRCVQRRLVQSSAGIIPIMIVFVGCFPVCVDRFQFHRFPP